MTVHVISVGVSLPDSLGDPLKRWRSGRRGPVRSGRERRRSCSPAGHQRRERRECLAPARSPRRRPGSPRRAAPRTGLPDWPRRYGRICGRMKSAPNWPHSPGPGRGDPLRRQTWPILVCSDTPIGLVAGLWNAVALAGGDLGRVRYLAVPEQLGDRARHGRAGPGAWP